MPRLSQVVATTPAVKKETHETLSALYAQVKKPALFNGSERVYVPHVVDSGGTPETLPPEHVKVQLRYTDLLEQVRIDQTRVIDAILTQDVGNKLANADVVIDGKVVAPGVPVATLLMLEERLNNFVTFLESLPTPDPGYDWEYDPQQGLLRSQDCEVQRTKKVPYRFEKAAATDKHPAQVEVFTEDKIVGHYTKTLYSGAPPYDKKSAMVVNAKKLRDAIKIAREEANGTTDVQRQYVGDKLFDYIFAPLTQ